MAGQKSLPLRNCLLKKKKKTAQMQYLKLGDAYNILSEDTKPEMKKAKSVQKRMPTRSKFGLE